MISCTQFILAYNELFKFLEKREGYQGVLDYWRMISDKYVEPRLGARLDREGIAGCYSYWSHSLNEEAAGFTMELDEEAGRFEIIMRDCPSKNTLLKMKETKPYARYCNHCDALYKNVVEKRGFQYESAISEKGCASCLIRITGPKRTL